MKKETDKLEVITKKEAVTRYRFMKQLENLGGNVEFSYALIHNLDLLKPEFDKQEAITKDYRSKLEAIRSSDKTLEEKQEEIKALNEEEKSFLDKVNGILEETLEMEFRKIPLRELQGLYIFTNNGKKEPIALSAIELRQLMFMIEI